MPHFTLPVALPGGPVIDIMVGPSQARAHALSQAGQPVPVPVSVRALIDTGASCTCIDPAALSTLGLSPRGVTPVFTPSTGSIPHLANTYDVSIVIPCGTMIPLSLPNVPITESALSNQGIHALLGRDVLSRCIFIYNIYNGQTQILSLAF